VANGWAAIVALIEWLRHVATQALPAAIGGYIQHLSQERRTAMLNAAIERSNADETRRNAVEFEAYRADPDGTDKWLRERAGLIDGNNL